MSLSLLLVDQARWSLFCWSLRPDSAVLPRGDDEEEEEEEVVVVEVEEVVVVVEEEEEEEEVDGGRSSLSMRSTRSTREHEQCRNFVMMMLFPHPRLPANY